MTQQQDVWNHEAAQRYDTPGEGMFAPEVLGPTVDRLAELAKNGPALEFGIGTGRVAVPLAARGVRVAGIELSLPMIAQLRKKADEATIPVVVGDMATADAPPGKYALVYLVFNTISNLLTQTAQVACFRNAARHLEPGGRFVIELWVPDLRRLPPGQQATVWRAEPGYMGITGQLSGQRSAVSQRKQSLRLADRRKLIAESRSLTARFPKFRSPFVPGAT